MLRSLEIKNIVLIDELNIDFTPGYTVLTGETGAGKSIMLDALGLALGGRADRKLVRQGESLAYVCAAFEVRDKKKSKNSILQDTCAQLEIPFHGELMLRRTLRSDGRTKSFINDVPVSTQTLKTLSENLIEIHGQFDKILNHSNHLNFLDNYAQNQELIKTTTTHYNALVVLTKKYTQTQSLIHEQKKQQEYLEFSVDELKKVNPEIGEEALLLEKRHSLKNSEKIVDTYETLNQLLQSPNGILAHVNKCISKLERQSSMLGSRTQELLGQFHTIYAQVSETAEEIISGLENCHPQENLEEVEDRLYEIRALARKHSCQPDDLGRVLNKFQEELELVSSGDQILLDLEKELKIAKETYLDTAVQLSLRRKKYAQRLENEVHQELLPLKLDKVAFKIDFREKQETSWSANGLDQICFLIRTNLGHEFGPIHKVASGGEQSRFMLAMRVVLAEHSDATILIFDEIDAGVGGAVASAIGERMSRLGKTQQVLSITHSPQVAAHANTHFTVKKYHDEAKDSTTTQICPLNLTQSTEELARMLSGDQITEAARNAARQLKGN